MNVQPFKINFKSDLGAHIHEIISEHLSPFDLKRLIQTCKSLHKTFINIFYNRFEFTEVDLKNLNKKSLQNIKILKNVSFVNHLDFPKIEHILFEKFPKASEKMLTVKEQKYPAFYHYGNKRTNFYDDIKEAFDCKDFNINSFHWEINDNKTKFYLTQNSKRTVFKMIVNELERKLGYNPHKDIYCQINFNENTKELFKMLEKIDSSDPIKSFDNILLNHNHTYYNPIILNECLFGEGKEDGVKNCIMFFSSKIPFIHNDTLKKLFKNSLAIDVYFTIVGRKIPSYNYKNNYEIKLKIKKLDFHKKRKIVNIL